MHAESAMPFATSGPSAQGGLAGPSQPQDELTQRRQLVAVTTTVLKQALDLVERVLPSDDTLTTHSQHIPGSTIGKHLRHARDHFVALLDCMCGPAPRTLSYDGRKRGTPMESSLEGAREGLRETIAQIEELVPRVGLNEPLTLYAITPFAQSVQTTVGRELWFCGLHAVHHWSMVRVIASEIGYKLEESFGFAPSTLVYQGSEGPLGAKAKI